MDLFGASGVVSLTVDHRHYDIYDLISRLIQSKCESKRTYKSDV